MPDGLREWVNWQTFTGAVFAALVGTSMKLLQVMIRDRTDRFKLKLDEATEIRKELRDRVTELEGKLELSDVRCENRMELLRKEYEKEIQRLEKLNTELIRKITRIESDVREVQEKTAEISLPRKEGH